MKCLFKFSFGVEETAALSSATQYAMPPKFGGKWKTAASEIATQHTMFVTTGNG